MSCTGFSFALFLNFLSPFVSFSKSIRSPARRRNLPQSPSKLRSFLFFSFPALFSVCYDFCAPRFPFLYSECLHFPAFLTFQSSAFSPPSAYSRLTLLSPHPPVASPFCRLVLLSFYPLVAFPFFSHRLTQNGSREKLLLFRLPFLPAFQSGRRSVFAAIVCPMIL